MTQAHWQMLLLIGMILGLMLCFSLGTRAETRLYRWTGRIFWAFVMLQGMQVIGGVGINGGNLALVSVLGIPGAAALMAIALM
ncbi:MAG: hypothetical protein IJD39_01060 [Clostridia bacterium]|nr:hypothetical protein [Clostridia bacterium]